MTTTNASYGKLCFKDVISPAAIRYLVLVNSTSIELLRVVGKRRAEVLFGVRETCPTSALFQRFAADLVTSPVCLGQPLEILINNERAYTYIKRTDATSPAQILEDIRSIPGDHQHLTFSGCRRSNSTFLVAQAIEKTYIASLESTVAANGLLVSDVTTLAAYLFYRAPVPARGSATVCVFDFSTFCCSLLFDANQHVLFLNRPHPAGRRSCQAMAVELSSACLGPAQKPDIATYRIRANGPAPQDDIPAGDLGEILGAHAWAGRHPKGSFYRGKTRRLARVLGPVFNIARLLLLILGLLSVISVIAAPVTRFIAADTDALTSTYQGKYNAMLGLNRHLDSLQVIRAKILDEHASGISVAAIVSSFCQERYRGTCLNRITVRRIAKDTLVVQVDGAADSERAVFRYHQALNKLIHPYHLSISSVAPQVVTAPGGVDTVFNFRLSAVIDEPLPLLSSHEPKT